MKTYVTCWNVGGSHCLIKSTPVYAQQSLKRHRSIEQSRLLTSVVARVPVHVTGHFGVGFPCFAGVGMPSSFMLFALSSSNHVIDTFLYLTRLFYL